MTTFNYQNPAATDAILDSTQVDPGPSGGPPTMRENMVTFGRQDERHSQEMQAIHARDLQIQYLIKRGSERISLFDNRGGTGRGTTR